MQGDGYHTWSITGEHQCSTQIHYAPQRGYDSQYVIDYHVHVCMKAPQVGETLCVGQEEVIPVELGE